LPYSAHLRRERSELRAQLNQKISILVEVRAALQEASLREAATKTGGAYFKWIFPDGLMILYFQISNLRRSLHK